MITKQKPQSRFLEIICPRCKSKQTIYGKSSTKIKCKECNKLLMKTTGGKTKIKARIKEVLA